MFALPRSNTEKNRICPYMIGIRIVHFFDATFAKRVCHAR